MGFTNTKYESDSGEIFRIRLNDETVPAAGAAPGGAVTINAFVKVSKSEREFGIRPRYVTLSREVGTAPDTFTKYRRLPVLTPAAFNSAAFAAEGTVTIDGDTWTISGREAEDY